MLVNKPYFRRLLALLFSLFGLVETYEATHPKSDKASADLFHFLFDQLYCLVVRNCGESMYLGDFADLFIKGFVAAIVANQEDFGFVCIGRVWGCERWCGWRGGGG